MLDPSILFTRPIGTMSEHWGRNGAAWRVSLPVRVQQQPRRRDVLEVRDQPVHHVAGIGRICDDRIGRAVMVERKRILAGTDVAAIDTAQAEGFQMPDQRAVAGTRLGKACGRREDAGSAAPPLPWRRVEISLAALEVGTLAHQLSLRRRGGEPRCDAILVQLEGRGGRGCRLKRTSLRDVAVASAALLKVNVVDRREGRNRPQTRPLPQIPLLQLCIRAEARRYWVSRIFHLCSRHPGCTLRKLKKCPVYLRSGTAAHFELAR